MGDKLDIAWKFALALPLAAAVFLLIAETGLPGIALFTIAIILTALAGPNPRN